MATNTLRHFNVAHVYGTPVRPSGVYISIDPPATERIDIQRAARLWFSKRKLRQRTRQIMDFISLPSRVTLKYRLEHEKSSL